MRTNTRHTKRRIVVVSTLAISPLAAFAFSGCTSEDDKPATMTSVDVGGTFGAEVSVAVTGRGRVIGSIPNSIDCPTNCFVRYTFTDPASPVATAGLGLKAIATEGTRFTGWKFEPVELGTKSRGPDNCNPVKRAASLPQVDTSAAEIQLAYGETQGTAPAGQESLCQGTTTVPLAYRVTAAFEEIPIIEAGPDVQGDGGDGGAGDILFPPTQVGSVAKQIGVAGGYVYWKWETPAGVHGISWGSPSLKNAQTIASTVTASGIPVFEVDGSYVLFQQAGGSVYVITGGGDAPIPMTGSNAYACVALASDGANVLCRTAGPDGKIVSWTIGGVGPTLLQEAVPPGTDLAIYSSFYLLIPDNSAGGAGKIYYASKTAMSDAGAAGWTTVVSGRSNIREYELGSSSRPFWLEYDPVTDVGTGHASSSYASSTVYTTQPATTGLKFLTPDTSSTYAYVATPSSIFRVYYTGSQSTPYRSGLNGIGGIAVDSSYVYWTQSDGRVYRASK